MRKFPLKKLGLSKYEALLLPFCIVIALLMLVRVFYGTELTDEAFYVSDALTMMHGNIPYAYNNFSYGTGGTFLMIPFLFIYELLVPNDEGIFLYTRICFILFLWVTVAVEYRILKKDFKKSSALLVSAFMLAFAGGGQGIYNFSYNTSPLAMTYMAGLIIYDSVEHKSKQSPLKLVLAGFLMGISVLGHIGYGVVILIFAIIIVTRSNGLRAKILNVTYCVIGGLVEMIIVFVPIIALTGFQSLLSGLHNFFHPYSMANPATQSLQDNITIIKAISVAKLYMILIPCFAVAYIFSYFFSKRYIRENEKKLGKSENLSLALSITMAMSVLMLAISQVRVTSYCANWYWGVLAIIGISFLLSLHKFKEHPLILYMGIYPIIFSFGEIFLVNSSACYSRFSYSVPALAIYFLVMLNEKGELAGFLATVGVAACTLAMMMNNYRYIYRDGNFKYLTYKVESSVYKGIYTTKERASCLPELEEFLNKFLSKEDFYALRDNVPFGYLMIHTGTMCDMATWDCLLYSDNKCLPVNLYDFYTRRKAFPQKYIYIDYGRDNMLSIEDSEFKLNEFINSYYRKTMDFSMNDMFRRIVVYEYNGEFDGDFGPWIGRYLVQ